jgi:(2Fe-2S) ferredoxin
MLASTMPRPERHLLVCANNRPTGGKPSCGARGSGEVLAAFQEAVGVRPDLWGKVAVTPTGCLGPCFEGPVVVVYPDAVWYTSVAPADAQEIVREHVVGGCPVERLRYPWPED